MVVPSAVQGGVLSTSGGGSSSTGSSGIAKSAGTSNVVSLGMVAGGILTGLAAVLLVFGLI